MKGMRAVVETGGIKIACVTTKQNNEAFDKVYDRELATLENRLVGTASGEQTERRQCVLTFLRSTPH